MYSVQKVGWMNHFCLQKMLTAKGSWKEVELKQIQFLLYSKSEMKQQACTAVEKYEGKRI